CSGVIQLSVGTSAAQAAILVPGDAYRLRYLDSIGHTFNNPAAPTSCACDADSDGNPDCSDSCTDTDGDGLGNPGFPQNACILDNCPGAFNPNQNDSD